MGWCLLNCVFSFTSLKGRLADSLPRLADSLPRCEKRVSTGMGGEDWAEGTTPVEGQEGRPRRGRKVRSPPAKQEVHGEQGGERGRRETDRKACILSQQV